MDKMRSDYSDEYFDYVRLKAGRPMNETEEHFFCKSVGQVYLFHRCNCRYIGTEIHGCWHLDEHIPGYSNSQFYGSRDKTIIDCLGITRKDEVFGIEAKATLSDYHNGFCACMPYTYIICPKDVIPKSEIPKDIGLIYVDIPKFHIVGYDEIYGVDLVKIPRRRIDARWLTNGKNGKFDEDRFNNALNKWYDEMCYRNTLHNVFNRNNIPIYKKVPK